MKTTNHQMITIKKNSKMKTIKLNKNSKARQSRKTKLNAKLDAKAGQITDILAYVSEMCDYAIKNLCTELSQFEELGEKLWKLTR